MIKKEFFFFGRTWWLFLRTNLISQRKNNLISPVVLQLNVTGIFFTNSHYRRRQCQKWHLFSSSSHARHGERAW